MVQEEEKRNYWEHGGMHHDSVSWYTVLCKMELWEVTTSVKQDIGVRQCYGLSLYLFNIFIDDVI